MEKNLVITGGTSGIGLAVSKLALSKGYTVFALSRNELQENINNKSLYFIKADISSIPQIESAKKKVGSLLGINKIDLFINCAGIGYEIAWKKITEKNYEKFFSTNIKGLIFATQIFYPLIKKKSGIICNISSVAGIKGFANWSLYCATKFAVEGFSESLRNEVRKDGVRVLTIRPGSVNTPFYNYLSDDQKKDFINASTIATLIISVAETPANTSVENIFINNSVGDL